ncbi:MAG TPA: hypothetical protein DCQ45_08155 [Erysipelotrichaceae bacterium]|nr:hypothetical protein [Erysipelotrichaceae bacterium]
MAEIRVLVNGNEYSEDQFKKDLIRMFDGIREENSEYMGTSRCTDVKCEHCPLPSCLESYDEMKSKCFEGIGDVYEWSQEHPVVTNRDKMIETFGGAYFNLIINYISDRSLEDYDIWLHEEYKEPKGESKNDD